MANPTSRGAESLDDRAARLLRIGLDTAVRIRDEDPDAVAGPVNALDRDELRDLVVLLAACVDVSRPVTEVVWWTDIAKLPRAHPTPRGCGTARAYRRHRAHGEPPDLSCEVGYRRSEADRTAKRRAA